MGAVCIFAVLALFVFRFFTTLETLNTQDWNARSFALANSQAVALRDCLFPKRQFHLWKLPTSTYGEKIKCIQVGTEEDAISETLLREPITPQTPDYWGQTHFLDISWDAYSTWYRRATAMFYWSQTPEWPGLWKAHTDPQFLSSFEVPEHQNYPYALSIIYFGIQKLFASPNPIPLQMTNFFIFVLSAFLFFKLWPSAPKALWFLIALPPLAGGFLFSLYADVWVLFGILCLFLALEKKSWLALLPCLLLPWFKVEASLQVFCFLSTWAILKKRIPLWPTLALAFSAILYKYWTTILDPTLYYASLWDRLGELRTYTERLPKILGYFSDVLVRPGYWVIFWPLLFWDFYKTPRSHKLAFAPLFLLLLTIPLAYLRFPDGSFKEVILTGSNRALWQSFPLAWLLLKEAAKF